MSDIRTRREPPHFRRVRLARLTEQTPHLVRVTLTGDELAGLDPGLPAASVRLLLPRDSHGLVVPTWNGNEFLFDDGSRPPIRTLTPLRLDGVAHELDVAVVRHGEAPLSSWVDAAAPGDEVAVAGTGRGYEIDPAARSYLLAGDESALPAIGVLLDALPADAAVRVLVEARDADRLDLPVHPGATLTASEPAPGRPGAALVDLVVRQPDLGADVRVWAAGEAAAVQAIRRHLFEDRGLPRSQAVVRGYWKIGRRGG